MQTRDQPTRPSIDGLNDVEVHDSTDLLERDSVPESLAVIGGGYVGCEYAQIYSQLGADVTVFQRGDRLLPDAESAVSAVIETAFEDEGITVQTGAPVTALTETDDGIRVDADADGTVSVTVSDVALAAGRTPNTDGLRLEDIGVSLHEDGFVEADDSFRTTAEGVYAIGDVSGPPMITHSARDGADLLYRHLEKDADISTEGRTVPWAVFTDPQVGQLTEQEAREKGYEVGIGRQDLAEQGKPKALGETEGFVKLATEADTDELLGAYVVGEQGAEIVHELVLAIELGATVEQIANTMHIHPTLPESINSAAGGVHKPS